MRIIAGKYRGRKLEAVPGAKTRPTADRVREALFSVLGDTVRSARVLDLFAGTGALGLEALSRGASRAVMVENDSSARAVIESNIAALGLEDTAEPILGDWRGVCKRLAGRGEKFDLILADPPYRDLAGENLLADIGRFAILARDGIVMIEHSAEAEPDRPKTGWRRLRRKQYDRTVLSFFDREPGKFGPAEVSGKLGKSRVSEASDLSEASDPAEVGPGEEILRE